MMKKIRIILSIIACWLCAIGFVACKKPEKVEPSITFLMPNNQYVVEVGLTNTIDVSYNGTETIVYTSSNTDIVTVSASGVITGVAEGEAFVTITAGEFSAACKVSVTHTEYSIALGGTDINLVVGAQKNFNAILYKDGTAYAGEVQWTISNEEKCGFTYNGNSATFKAQETGIFTITATSDKTTAQCRIKVVDAKAQRLESPTLSVEKCDTLKWTEVAGAKGYAVLVDNDWVETTETSYSFASQMEGVKDGETLSVAVKALSKDDVNYLDSLLSGKALSHAYSMEKLSEVTCTKKGNVRYTCQTCERTYTVENYKEEHVYEDARCTACQTLQSPGVLYLYDDNYIPMLSNAEAAVAITEENENDTSLWKVKYRAYWEEEMTERINLPADDPNRLSAGSVNDARMLWTMVYNNRANIPEADRQGCYYVGSLTDEAQEVYVTSTYNDGRNGEAAVKYVKSGVFSENSFIRKVVFPESITELRGGVFQSSINLETVIMPGITYMPAIAEASYGHNNFNDCYALKTVVVGDGWFHYGRNFMAQTPSMMPSGYTPQVDIYVQGTTQANILANSGYLALNQNLSGNVYYYDETASLCDTWNYDENGEMVKRFHNYVKGVCKICGQIDSEGVAYAYDAEKDCYYVANNAKIKKSVVKILSEYNDGINGLKPVTYVVASAFQFNANVQTIILPESVVSVGGSAFFGCEKLETVIMPGVLETTGINVFCRSPLVSTVVVNPNANFYRKTFITDTADYVAKIDLLIYGSENKITFGTDNNMLTGNVAFYTNKKGGCATWSYDYDDETIVKSEHNAHSYVNGKCEYCQAIDTQGIVYGYDSVKDCYYVANNVAFEGAVARILGEYNDGTNGLKPVSYVVDSAFHSNKNVEIIVLSDNVTSVGGSAFFGCTKLKTVIMPGVLETTGINVFCRSPLVTTVVVNPNANFYRKTFITDTADYTASLDLCIYGTENNITMSENNMIANVYYFNADSTAADAWNYAEDGITVEKSSLISEGVAYAYDSDKDCYYVADNTKLNKQTVKILAAYNDGINGMKPVSYVAGSAFQGNTKIVTVILPDSVTSVGSSAFFGCTKLTAVVMPGVVKTEGVNVFYNCTALTTVVINGEAKLSRKTFYVGEIADYDAQVNLYIVGENTITYWNYGATPPVEYEHQNNMLTNNVYLYATEEETLGTWYYGADGLPVLRNA